MLPLVPRAARHLLLTKKGLLVSQALFEKCTVIWQKVHKDFIYYLVNKDFIYYSYMATITTKVNHFFVFACHWKVWCLLENNLRSDVYKHQRN